MLHDTTLEGPCGSERHLGALRRIAALLGCTVDDLAHGSRLEQDAAETVEMLRLWQRIEAPETRQGVIEGLRQTPGLAS